MKETDTVKGDIEFWRWQEYQRIMPNIKWTKKDLITAGVDVGSVGSKAAIMVNGQAYSWGITRTGSNSPESAKKVLDWALMNTGLKLDDIKYIVGTGYGRVNVPMQKELTTFGDQASEPYWTWEDKT
jgi:benzoyl-CoA reductase subunit A